MLIARGLAAVALLAAAAAPATADELLATRGQPLDEIAHTVAVRIADGVATYTVQRQFHNRGKLAEEARLAIDLPAGAAATGLRIRTSGKWHTGELLDRELAAERYRELTGAGVHDPKDPALLFWISASELYLQVFPVLPGATNTVEYTLTVPTRYAAGRYWLTYPRVDPAAARSRPELRKLVDPVVTVHPAWAPSPGGIVVDGKPAAPGQAVALASHGRPPWQAAAAGERRGAGAGDDPDADLRYGASVLEVPTSPQAQLRYTLGKVRLELQHPARSDLELQLVTPAGELVDVARGSSDTIPARAVFDVRFPTPVRAAGRWRLVVRSDAADAGAVVRWSLALGDRTFAADAPAFVPGGSDLPGVAVASVEPPPISAWIGRLGRVVASNAHAFARLELEAAPRLSAVPRRAGVVFVLDASRSAAHLLDAQLAIVRAYLAHVPDAELEIVAVRRRASRLFGRFATVAEARQLLDAAVRAGALAPGNGSALDEGAKLAASLLAGRTGPQRVVLATDELLRSGLGDAAALAALAALPPAAVVHVVVPSTGAAAALPSLTRDDGAPLAALAAAHHGILARIAGLPAKAPELEPVVLELVRPTRIEHLAIAGGSSLTIDDVLHEGEGVRLFHTDLTAAAAPSSLSLTGKLWSDPIRIDLAAAPGFSNATAAFVFGSEGQHDHLSAAEQRTVALAARAVSPVTSYLAIEPGVRPSKIGLEGEEIGTAGWGTIGAGSYGRLGGHGVRLRVDRPDLASLVPTAACLRKHPPAGPWSVRLAVETTRDEIVDIAITRGAGPLATCLAEAAWSIRLPSMYNLERDHHTADLSGP